jgi:hypothetical protein
LGLRPYFYLALAQYLTGQWDDVLLTAEQGFSAAAIDARRYELPMLHLAAGCVPAGRGQTGEAERHAALAEEAAASLHYGPERPPAAMARALVCQAAGDYRGMAGALGPWQNDAALDERSRLYAALWRPLLAEGLAGSGQTEQATVICGRLRAEPGQVSYLAPALAWLEGWLAEQRGATEQAREIYQRGEDAASPQSPVYRPAAAGPRPAPAADRPAAPGGRAPAASREPVPGAARGTVRRPDRTGAGCLRVTSAACQTPLRTSGLRCGSAASQDRAEYGRSAIGRIGALSCAQNNLCTSSASPGSGAMWAFRGCVSASAA